MADAVAVKASFTGKRRKIIHMTCVSDGSGETGIIKIDRSAITDGNGAVPNSIDVVSARWAIQGFSYIKLLWHHNAGDVVAMLLTGNGYENYEGFGNLHDTTTTNADADDGDIQLTSAGAANGATYDITLEVSY